MKMKEEILKKKREKVDKFLIVNIFLEKSGSLSRLFLLAEECIVLCVSPSRSSLPRLHHETPHSAEVRLPRVHWSRIHETRCRSCRVSAFLQELFHYHR